MQCIIPVHSTFISAQDKIASPSSLQREIDSEAWEAQLRLPRAEMGMNCQQLLDYNNGR